MESKLILLETPELESVEKSKAKQIKATFDPMVEMLVGFEGDYLAIIADSKEGITPELTAKAKRLRLDIRKVRTEAEKVRKAQKEEFLRAGKAIDAVSNLLKWAITDKEKGLEEIEKHFEIQEQKRLSALQNERVEKLALYVEDANERDLTKFKDDEFEALLLMKKKAYEDSLEAKRIAEEERIKKEKEQEAERERIKLENERLKKEADERQRKLDDERKKVEEKHRKEREALESKLKAEREERERIEREEREKREKVEAELKAKKEAERLEQYRLEAEKQAELRKGDEDKVLDLIKDLKELKTKYSFKSSENKKMYSDVGLLLEKVIAHIQR